MIAGLTARTKDVQAARKVPDKAFSFTRRFIAIVSVLTIVALPLLASTYIPDFALSYGYVENKGGFWFFSDGRDVMKFVTLTGMTLLPFHTHMMSAIAGLYFGQSSVK
jgi:hypothetical protein